MTISTKLEQAMVNASWVRRMFDQGVRMKRELGADKVLDFSLGNPSLEPPLFVRQSLQRWASELRPGLHRYMPNAGYEEVRGKIASYWAEESSEDFIANDVIMTVGAGGALNCVLKALLNPGDEVIVIAPFFPEYTFYIDNHGGKLALAESNANFDLDLNELDRIITHRTKAIIINSPNNPTGRVYTIERLRELGKLLARKESITGHTIHLISDDPYRKIIFDEKKSPNVFAAYPNTVLVMSHSKDLGLAGERIGYVAISPRHADRQKLSDAITFAVRILGFVNASALFQRVVADAQQQSVSIKVYQELRDLLCAGLEQAGYEFIRPQGAFYVFPKTPIPDDVEFVQVLKHHRLLAVPGSGFGRKGYIRLSFCITKDEIERSIPIFKQAIKEVRIK